MFFQVDILREHSRITFFSFQNDREFWTMYEIKCLEKYHIIISVYSIWGLMYCTLAKYEYHNLGNRGLACIFFSSIGKREKRPLLQQICVFASSF